MNSYLLEFSTRCSTATCSKQDSTETRAIVVLIISFDIDLCTVTTGPSACVFFLLIRIFDADLCTDLTGTSARFLFDFV